MPPAQPLVMSTLNVLHKLSAKVKDRQLLAEPLQH